MYPLYCVTLSGQGYEQITELGTSSSGSSRDATDKMEPLAIILAYYKSALLHLTCIDLKITCFMTSGAAGNIANVLRMRQAKADRGARTRNPATWAISNWKV